MSAGPRLSRAVWLVVPLLVAGGWLAGGARADHGVAKPVTVEPDGRVRGTVVLIHGGGWQNHGVEVTTQMAQDNGPMIADWGYRAVSIDYAPGRSGFQDVLAAIDRIHDKAPDRPLCLWGISAGGHWALMAAAQRSWIRCVVSVAAPTDLQTPQYLAPSSYLAKTAAQLFHGVTGAYSPVVLADDIAARVLLAHNVVDGIVPFPQALVMADRLRGRSRLLAMPPGTIGWGHGGTTAAAIERFRTSARDWLATTASGSGTG